MLDYNMAEEERAKMLLVEWMRLPDSGGGDIRCGATRLVVYIDNTLRGSELFWSRFLLLQFKKKQKNSFFFF